MQSTGFFLTEGREPNFSCQKGPKPGVAPYFRGSNHLQCFLEFYQRFSRLNRREPLKLEFFDRKNRTPSRIFFDSKNRNPEPEPFFKSLNSRYETDLVKIIIGCQEA